MSRRLAAELPDFPWDTLAAAKATAQSHPDGLVDLSVGTPVDPTPAVGVEALTAAADSPGYPQTAGTPALQQAIADYLRRRWGAEMSPSATLPVIGTKELVAWLPTLLGLGAGDTVVVPTMAYPTYRVGALLAGCAVREADELDTVGDDSVRLVWLNSPSNPTGETLSPAELRRRLSWARARGVVVASDECYGEFGWEAEPTSMLNAEVSGGDHRGLLALHSLSKRSNLAGYRAGFVAGDPSLIRDLLAVRKHLGMIVPGPVQAAMTALLADDDHVAVQRQRYAARRSVLRPALESAGFRVEHSEGGLYLWATRGEEGRASVNFLAGLGVLVAPGEFYGSAAGAFVRIALTATDERIHAAASRLTAA